MEKPGRTETAAVLAKLCDARLGDCAGMAAAGATFLCLAPVEGPEAAFRYAGFILGTAGMLLAGLGLMERRARR